MPRRSKPKLPSPRDAELFRRVVIQGQRQTDVAREFELSKQRVGAICERLRRMSFEELTDDFSEHRRQTLLRLENVYSEAMSAWEASKAGTESVTQTVSDIGSTVASTTRRHSAGDVKYLAEARQALANIRELCGFDATKTEIVELCESKTVTASIDFSKLSKDELYELATIARLEEEGVLQFVEQPAPQGGTVRDVGTLSVFLKHPSAP